MTCLSYANVISEFALASQHTVPTMESVLSFTDSHFSAADARCCVEFCVLLDVFFLYTVSQKRPPFYFSNTYVKN